MKLRPALAAIAIAATTLATAAHAVDGVKLIDQSRALAGNVTPGDAPGFPVLISEPGSYRLASNLVVGDPTVHAVLITSPGVTLDLNGFALIGTNQCTGQGTALNCTSDSMASDSRGDGVRVHLPAQASGTVSVENGSVLGFAGNGLRGIHAQQSIGYVFSADRLRVAHSGIVGITGVERVSRSSVQLNSHGIHLGGFVIDTAVRFNRGTGLFSIGWRHVLAVGNGTNHQSSYPLD